MSRQHVIARQ